MKKLTCEMCGSSDLIKKDGVYVCQNCGMKYSAEEAKKMMIEGTVRIDNTASVTNYLEMAKSAYKNKNLNETEQYCNKIIEIEPENYEAWLLKGQAAGWQSSVMNMRIEETVNCLTKAIDFAPEDKRDEVKKEAGKAAQELALAFMKLCCDNFKSFPTQKNVDIVKKSAYYLKETAGTFIKKCDGNVENLCSMIHSDIFNAAGDAWRNAREEFDRNEHPSKYSLENLISRGDLVVSLYNSTFGLIKQNNTQDAAVYEMMILIEQQLISARSKKFTSDFGGMWVDDYGLDDNARQSREFKISDWKSKRDALDPSYAEIEKPVPKTPEQIKEDRNGAIKAMLLCSVFVGSIVLLIVVIMTL